MHGEKIQFKTLLLWLLIVCAVLGLGSYYFAPQQFDSAVGMIGSQFGLFASVPGQLTLSPQVSKSLVMMQQGDFSDAANAAEQVLSASSHYSQSDDMAAHLVIDSISISTATSSVERNEAISSLIRTYVTASSTPLYQAETLDNLITALSAGDASAFNMVAQEPSLARFLVPTSTSASITNLARYSYSIYPTSAAAYLLATYPKVGILMYYQQKNDPVMAEKLAQAETLILQLVNVGDNLLVIENQSTSTNPRIDITNIGYDYLNRASLLATVALIDPSYTAKAHAAFQQLFDYYNVTRDDSGNSYDILLLPVADGYLWEAQLMYLADPKTNADLIESDLRAFVQTIQKNQVIQQGQLVAINAPKIVEQGKQAVEAQYGNNSWVSMKNTYDLYVSLAKISPEFQSFLISQGWKLSQ
ncbi:MAG TPA: hypothetical protein VMU27_00135 [Candidatus Paceibacterota bacterium]|nr:hypothetical protein [Candidatus Paceibacterota bacterium]